MNPDPNTDTQTITTIFRAGRPSEEIHPACAERPAEPCESLLLKIAMRLAITSVLCSAGGVAVGSDWLAFTGCACLFLAGLCAIAAVILGWLVAK